MNTASQVYEQLRAKSLDGRELEASVLSRAARKLNRCVETWNQPTVGAFREKLADALAFNLRLWTFLQVELSNPEHPLQQELRRNLLQLSYFIDKTTMQLRAGGTVEELKCLAGINQQIASGLTSGHASHAPLAQKALDSVETHNNPFNVTA
ncbi:MAG: flagellar biosynthesis regulator FlaF [Acidobacteriota bacterium]